MRRDSQARGLTLVELLVVIAVVVILLALLLPALQLVRSSSRAAQCRSQLRQLGVAFHKAQSQIGGAQIGVAATWPEKLAPYVGNDPRIVHCPDDQRPAADAQISYGLNSRALRMSGGDSGKLLMLDHNRILANVGGQNADDWPTDAAPRHRGSVNAVNFDGSVQSRAMNEVDPRVGTNFFEVWLPLRDGGSKPGLTGDGPTTIAALSTTSCPSVPSVQANLAAHYTFDNPANLGEDATGFHNATYHPAKCVSVDDPDRCKVALFRSDSEAGVVGDAFRILGNPLPTSGKPDWTIAYWWRFDNTGTQNILSGFGSCQTWGSRFYANNGERMWLHACFSQECSLGQPAVAGQWQHFVGSLSLTAGKQRVWVNGALRNECVALGSVATLQSLVLNAIDNFPGSPFPNFGATGHFDDVRIYDRALNGDEVIQLYQEGLPSTGGTTTGGTTGSTSTTTTGGTTTSTSTSGTTTGAAPDPLCVLDQTYGFFQSGSYTYAAYPNVKFIKATNNINSATGSWYVITSVGDLKPWLGSTTYGSTIASVGVAVYNSPPLLHNAFTGASCSAASTSTTTGSVTTTGSTTGTTSTTTSSTSTTGSTTTGSTTGAVSDPLCALDRDYGFFQSGSYTYAANPNTQWIKATTNISGATNGWYVITSAGELRPWISGTTYGAVIANVGVAAYITPSLLHNAYTGAPCDGGTTSSTGTTTSTSGTTGGTTTGTSSTTTSTGGSTTGASNALCALDRDYGFFQSGSYTYASYPATKWIKATNNLSGANGSWYVITSAGELRPWISGTTFGTAIANVGVGAYDTPALLHNAYTGAPCDGGTSTTGGATTTTGTTTATGSSSTTTTGSATTTTTGGSTSGGGSPLCALDRDYGFFQSGSFTFAAYPNTKWVKATNNLSGATSSWYVIHSDGNLRPWISGTSYGAPVANVGTTTYADPSLLTNAYTGVPCDGGTTGSTTTGGTTGSTTTTGGVTTGGTTTGTTGSSTTTSSTTGGTATTTTSTTTGGTTTGATTTTTTTTTGGTVTTTTTTGATTTGGTTSGATTGASNLLCLLDRDYGFFQSGSYTFASNPNTKWIKATNNLNGANGSWYVITNVGALRPWISGTTYGGTIADVGVGVYVTPALLHNAYTGEPCP